jgi:transposase
MRFDLNDREWAIVEPLLPTDVRGKPRVDDRKVLNGIFYVLRTHCPWRDLPERYGPRMTVYNRFNRWAKRGVWQPVFAALAVKSKDSLRFIDVAAVESYRTRAGAVGEAPQLHRRRARKVQRQNLHV